MRIMSTAQLVAMAEYNHQHRLLYVLRRRAESEWGDYAVGIAIAVGAILLALWR